jgi:tRNA 2-thiocytidine biosynthesis protein TtcA
VVDAAARELELLERRLMSQVARTSHEYGLIEPDDRILVAVSGGKDSMTLLYLLREISKRAPFAFSLVAVNLDQGHPGFPERVLPDYFEREGYDYRILKEDTYSIVKAKIPEGKTYCSLCSRLRRGILYSAARELGATKIALGHHRDDAIETLLLNLFYSGQMKAMPPRLVSDDGDNVVIRPLALCAEKDIAALERDNPQLRGNLTAALGNVRPTHLFDKKLYRSEPDAPEPSELIEPAALVRRLD